MNKLLNNKRYCVVGTGLTGLATVRYLLSKQYHVELFDTRTELKNIEAIKEEFPGIDITLGNLEQINFSINDVLIVSPGIALTELFIEQAKANGAIISSDVEIFILENNKPVVAITGSNGKSTAVSLLTYVLNSIDCQSIAAGNIGLPVLEAITQDVDIFILELSSFQLERLQVCPSAVASILNVSEDHLDRYASMTVYAESKQIIYTQANAVVMNAQDNLTHTNKPVPQLSFGTTGAEFSYEESNGDVKLYSASEFLFNASEMRLKGSHNIENVLAVLAIVKHLIQQHILTVSLDSCLPAIKTFTGLPHRCQFIHSINDVDYINDSKATNVGASLAALNGLQSSYKTITLLLGGVDKTSDFSSLAAYVSENAVNTIIYGQDASIIAKAFDAASSEYLLADSMLAALTLAESTTVKNSAVLLAPACASFDEFDNFNARGNAFITAVKLLASNQHKELIND